MPGAGEDLSVSSLRPHLVACLRAVLPVAALVAAALVESAGRRWLMP
ncbi:MAG: hypothetical protein M3R57_08255 [Chloroflexota bacterium]|nr:hypothetical protein [Chloroflexota bacterium]